MQHKLILLLALLALPQVSQAQWVFRSAGTVSADSTGGATPGTPPGITVGDVALVEIALIGSGSITINAQSGWTAVYLIGAGSGSGAAVFCRVWQMGDSFPSFTSTGGSNHKRAQALAFHGPTASDCSTMLHASANQQTSSTNYGSPALTISTTNTLVIRFGTKDNNLAVDPMAVTCPAEQAYTQDGDISTTADITHFENCHIIETSAVSPTSQNFPKTGTYPNSAYASITIALLDQEAVAPTFAVSPSYAKVDTNTIRATFTCTGSTATAYGGLYVLGASAPTAAQVKAGTNAHGTHSAACTGSSQTFDIDATDSPVFPGYDPYVILDDTGGQSAVPTTSSTCVDPPTGMQFGNCPTGLTDVTVAGTLPKLYNDRDYITLPFDTQTSNFTVGDLIVDDTSGAWGFTLAQTDAGATGTLTIDKYSGTFADNDTLKDQHGGSALVNGSETAYTSVATGDIEVIATTVSPAGAALLLDGTTGEVSYTASGRQSALDGLFYDRSAGAYLSLDVDYWDGNHVPTPSAPQVLVLKVGVAMSTFDLSALFSDQDNDGVTYARVAGAMPVGLALDPATGALTGTPTVENEAGVAMSFGGIDPPFDVGQQLVAVYPLDTLPMTDCTTSPTPSSNCVNSIITDYHGSVTVVIGPPASSDTVASGNVISQDPAAGVETAPFETETLTISSGAPVSSSTSSNNQSMRGVGSFPIGP